MAAEDPVTSLGETEHGVNVREHMEFIDWVADHPEEAIVEFRAAGVAEDVANRTTATISEFALGGEELATDREHVLEYGLAPELESEMGFENPTDRFEAVEGALASLTACLNGTMVLNAIRQGIEIEDVSTNVAIPTDLRVLFGIHDLDRADEMYDELQIDIEVTGTDLTEEEKTRLAAFPKRSPVYNLITNAQQAEPTVTVTEP